MKKLCLFSESAIDTLSNKIKDKGSDDQSTKNVREEHQNNAVFYKKGNPMKKYCV